MLHTTLVPMYAASVLVNGAKRAHLLLIRNAGGANPPALLLKDM